MKLTKKERILNAARFDPVCGGLVQGTEFPLVPELYTQAWRTGGLVSERAFEGVFP